MSEDTPRKSIYRANQPNKRDNSTSTTVPNRGVVLFTRLEQQGKEMFCTERYAAATLSDGLHGS